MNLDEIEELRALVYESYLLFHHLSAHPDVLAQFKAGAMGRPLPYQTVMTQSVFDWAESRRLQPVYTMPSKEKL